MSLLDRIESRGKAARLNPVAPVIVPQNVGPLGLDDSQFSPDKYGDYIATSNEIYSAVSLRARLMSTLPFKLYDGYDADKQEVTSGPAWDLFRNVNPFWTFRRLIRMDELSMGLWGESFWAVEKKRGRPVEIWWLKPSHVRVVPDERNYIKGFIYEPVTGGDPIPFTPDEIVWFRYPNPIDEFQALSPMGAARQAADTAKAMMTNNANMFKAGLQLGGIIVPDADKVTFSQEQADELTRMLDKRWTGSQNAHRWQVLRFEAQFKALNITPKDAEFIAGMDLTLRQIANAYGIPLPLLNDLQNATLANVRDLQQIFWSHTLVPDAQFRAAEIEEQLLPMFRGAPNHCEFDFSKIPALQDSATETWTREAQALDRGTLTINEWRKSKGYPDVEWGDAFWAPVNKTPVTSAEPPAPPAPPAVPTATTPPEDTGTQDASNPTA